MLVYIDGFDTYNTADIGQRLNITDGTPSIVTTDPRTGSQCIEDNNPSFETWFRSVSALDTYISGWAIFRTGTNPGIMDFREGTTVHVHVRYNSLSGNLEVWRGYEGTLLGTAALSFPTDTWTYFEVKCVVHDSTGSVEVRVNGSSTPIINLTGVDTRNGGASGVIDNIGHRSDGGAASHRYDDWYICDTSGSINNDFLGDIRVDAIVPDGDGALTQLATTFPASPTTHFDKVDESLHDGDSTYNEDDIDNTIDLFTLENLPALSGTGVVHGVQTAIVAKKMDAGAKSMRHKMRVAGIDYDGNTQALATSYAAYLQMRETNPNTGVKFTEADVNSGIEVGYEVLP